MAKEPTGQSVVDPEPTGQSTEPQTPEPKEPEGDKLPEKFSGKSAADIAQAYSELERKLGEKSQEISDLKNQVAFTQQFSQQQEPRPDTIRDSYGQTYTQEGFPTQKEKDEFNWDNPQDSVREIMRKEWQKAAEQAQRRDSEIKRALFRARPALEQAKKETPHLFRGLRDEEVDGAIYNGLNSGLINQHNLTDPRTYKWAAAGILGEKTNYSYLSNPNVNPVEPTTMESPVGTKPHEPEEEKPLRLDEFGTELLKHRPEGMSEGDFFKLVKRGRSE